MAVVQKHPPLSAEQASVFCYQLALMQKAGISSEESVAILAEEARGGGEKVLLEQVRQRLAAGEALDGALGQTGAFPTYLLRMVSIGQASGRLDQVLEALAVYYRREAATQSAVRRAVTYPVVMAVLIAAVFLVLMARVLPVFGQVFSQLGMTLSPLVRGMMQFGAVSRYVAAALSVLLIAVALFLLYLFRAEGGRRLSARLSASFLAKSASARAVDRSRFAAAMALMLSSGLALDEAMERTATLLEQTALAPKIATCRAKMYEGMPFPRAVEEAGILDGLQSGLLAAGFRSGATEKAMEELSRRCQEEADDRLSRLLGRFEYTMVIVLCVSVGLVLLSVMLPLLGVMSAIGG